MLMLEERKVWGCLTSSLLDPFLLVLEKLKKYKINKDRFKNNHNKAIFTGTKQILNLQEQGKDFCLIISTLCYTFTVSYNYPFNFSLRTKEIVRKIILLQLHSWAKCVLTRKTTLFAVTESFWLSRFGYFRC